MKFSRLHLVGIAAVLTAASWWSIAIDAFQIPLSAAVDGVVVDDLGRSVPRARVALLDSKWAIVRSAATDASGKFVFAQLPAGSFLLAVSKGGYAEAMFGQFQPGRPGATLVLGESSRRSVVAKLPRGAVIAGTVLDWEGRPHFGTSIRAMRWVTRNGQRTLESAGAFLATESRGSYRLHGLEAGTYVLVATSPLGYATEFRRSGDESHDSGMIFHRVYYPSARTPGTATPVTVAAGDELTGIDFRIAPVPSARVEGRLVYPGDGQFAPMRVELQAEGDRDPYISPPSSTVATDGRFSIAGIPPGRYTVVSAARARASRPEDGWLWGTTEAIATANANASADVILNLQPGATVTGKLVFDGQAATPDLRSLTLDLRASEGPFRFQGSGQVPFLVEPVGTFRFTGVPPGTYSLSGRFVRPPWVLLSAMSRGRDILDFPIELKSAQVLGDLEVTLTDRLPQLSGQVVAADGKPMFECAVLVFPVDRRYWRSLSRRVRILQPDIDGRYSIQDLPPGEYHVAAIIDPLESDEPSPELLDALLTRSSRVTLGLGTKISQDLKLRTARH
ncbi:MAG TPA: carboxypeptidase regulatory-like domain-containing protein [Vicinamibacterales bacterium]